VETVVLDSNVVIGFLDPTDALHGRAVEAVRPWLAPARRRVVPASVYAEVLVHPIREGRDDILEAFLERAAVEVVTMGPALARRAAALQARFTNLALGDAFVLATALEQRAELLTFDWALSAIGERVR